MDALYLLHEYAWIEVLKRVTHPEDLKACSETCILFEQILWKKKTSFLFDLILPEVSKYLINIRQVGGDDGVEPYEEEDWQALFNCRAVCKDWCKSTDRFAETSSLFDDRYSFNSGERTERFLNIFERHDRNPILGKSVTIVHYSTLLIAQPQDDVQNEDVPFEEIFHVTQIRQLLNRFGNEIQSLELIEDLEDMGLADVDIQQRLRMENLQHLALCKNIQTMFTRLPNLRNLRLRSCDWSTKYYDHVEEMNQEHLNELATYITANPLPPLPHLDCIDIPGLNLIMTRSILEKYSSQLKRLKIAWHPIRFRKELPRFSCLKELDLSSLKATPSLQCLRQLQCPLERLSIDVCGGPEPLTVWPIDKLFQNIQHLPIRKLQIMNDSNLFLGESALISPDLRVRHESISEVCIIFCGGNVSLNFLTYCPNLSVLSTLHGAFAEALPSEHPNGVPELFDLTNLTMEGDDLYQSNIWEAIPSLNKFTLGPFYFGYYGTIEDDRRRGIHYYRKIYAEKKLENAKNAACP